jgi:hypothetical protein
MVTISDASRCSQRADTGGQDIVRWTRTWARWALAWCASIPS